jgi:hypothetical protein
MKPIPWRRPGWRPQIEAWIGKQLSRLGRRQVGEISQPYERPWSTVLRVPTDAGDLFCKATSSAQRQEVALTALLVRVRPAMLLPLLAHEPRQGWMLLPDGGRTLRELDDGRVLAVAEAVLPEYADVQRAVATRAEEILALGVPDRRPATLADAYAALLDDADVLRTGQAGGLTSDEHGRLAALAPWVASSAAAVADGPIPPTVEHSDLHDANVFVSDAGHRTSGHRIYDWGDTSIAHPFGSLLVFEAVLGDRLGLAPDSRELRRVRTAYLETWSDLASASELAHVATAVLAIQPIVQALVWQRLVSWLGGDEFEARHRDYAAASLRDLLTR